METTKVIRKSTPAIRAVLLVSSAGGNRTTSVTTGVPRSSMVALMVLLPGRRAFPAGNVSLGFRSRSSTAATEGRTFGEHQFANQRWLHVKPTASVVAVTRGFAREV